MENLIEYILSISSQTLMISFFMLWLAICRWFTISIIPTPVFRHKEWWPEYSQNLDVKASINHAYLWLKVNEPINHYKTEIIGGFDEDNRFTLFTTEYGEKRCAIQVNPKCIDNIRFTRACWRVYGTGRTEPDNISMVDMKDDTRRT